MAISPLSRVLQHLLTDRSPDGGGMTDGELLARFVRSRDEDALAALVRRHASMVWGVCRRLLNHHDAEDAFQATFLVLVRKAANVPKQAVANWLYGVARQTGVRVRATAAKRGRRETQVANMPEPAVPEGYDAASRAVLDEEVSRLPDHYRGVVVLCDLEGMTRKEAARQLGIPEGSVASRLARARALLAKRLSQRGILFSGSVVAVLSAGASMSAPPALVASTIQAASLLAAGQAAGVVSAKVAALTAGVVKSMFVSKLKAAFSVVMILSFLATGATILTYRTAAGQDDKKPTVEKPVQPPAKQARREEPRRNKESVTAWGNEVCRLQAGLGYLPGERRAYCFGETVTLVVRIRNVGKEEVKLQYLREFFKENSPLVTDADGKNVPQPRLLYTPLEHAAVDMSLAPGKEIELASETYQLLPASERGKGHSGRFPPLWTGSGKVSVQYNRLFGNTSSGRIKIDPDLLDLATGKLELEVKDDQPVGMGRPHGDKDARKDKGPVHPKTDDVVEAADLGEIYNANQARFDELYTDKTFSVRGKVTQIFRTKLASTDGEADYVVTMESDSGPPVQFFVSLKHRKALAELKVNKPATIRGYCFGMKGGSYTPTGIKHGEKSIHFYAIEISDGKGAGTASAPEETKSSVTRPARSP